MLYLLVTLSRMLFFPVLLVAIGSFLTLCAETVGSVDLSRTLGQSLAWGFVVSGILSLYLLGPALYGDRWQSN